jgi:hypothetical protein
MVEVFNNHPEGSILLYLVRVVVDVLFFAVFDDSSVCFWSCVCQFNDVIGQAFGEKLLLQQRL